MKELILTCTNVEVEQDYPRLKARLTNVEASEIIDQIPVDTILENREEDFDLEKIMEGYDLEYVVETLLDVFDDREKEKIIDEINSQCREFKEKENEKI